MLASLNHNFLLPIKSNVPYVLNKFRFRASLTIARSHIDRVKAKTYNSTYPSTEAWKPQYFYKLFDNDCYALSTATLLLF